MNFRTPAKRRVLLATALAAVLLPSCAFAVTFTRPLSLGSVGADVFSLQQLLEQQGFLSASPTGYFGPLTEAAIKQYQTAHGLEAVGNVGPLTRAVLNGTAASNTSTVAPACTSLSLTRPLGLGGTGSDVTALQQFLAKKNYLSVHPTGYFGPLTQAAVSNLQKDHGLEQVGSVGPLTRALIKQLTTSCPTQTTQSTATSTASTTITTGGAENTSTTTATTTSIFYGGGGGGGGGSGSGGGGGSTPDVAAPTAPTNLTAVAASLSELDLSWIASIDNVGVAGYQIFRDGTQIATDTSATTYADTGLTASSTHTYTVKAYDAAHNVSSSSNTATSTTGVWSDGFAGAPTGTAELPTLLQSYDVRSPWRVAGVDYPVGIPSGTSLKDPATISASGVSVSTSTHIVTVTGSNVTLNGYDFSLAGGWEVDQNSGASNLTIENSNFEIGANSNNEMVQRSGAGALTLLYNDFNGAGVNGSGANQDTLVVASGSGLIAEYNFFTNAFDDFVDIGFGSGNYTIKYNLFGAYGFGVGVHADGIQTWGNSIASLDVEFNTVYQPPPIAGFPVTANSFVRIGDQDLVFNGGGSYNGALDNDVNDPVIAYNTTAFLGDGAANVFQIGADKNSAPEITNLSIHDNYIDPTDNEFAVYFPLYGSIGTYIQNPSIYFNTDMVNGSTLLAGQFNDFNAGVPSGPPSAVIIAGVASSTTAILNGTATASSTVAIYDNSILLGTTTATTGGTWTYTTDVLANGNNSFTAKATDVYGNTGSLSSKLTVTIGAAPTLSSIASSPGATVATVSWNTVGDETNSKVVYGLTSSYGLASTSASFVTSHSINISGLSASTIYHYAVVSMDPGGLTSTSTDQTLTTSAPYVGPGDLVSGASAWWGLRGYDAAVSNGTTKAANICRASDSTCEDINILANGDFDASTAASFCTSTTCKVHTLYDQTGNGDNLVQTTVVKQPQLTLDGIGSLPTMTFSTTTYICLSSAPTVSQPWTMSIVAERTAIAGAGLFRTRDSSGNDVGIGYSAAADTFTFGAPSGFTTTITDNVWHALQAVASTTASAVFYDSSSSTGTLGSDGIGTFTMCLGSDAFDDANFTGAITEAGLWAGAFSTSTANSVNSNQHGYWGF